MKKLARYRKIAVALLAVFAVGLCGGLALWRYNIPAEELRGWLTDAAYAGYSFRFTGELVMHETEGLRMELLVEGKDAMLFPGS